MAACRIQDCAGSWRYDDILLVAPQVRRQGHVADGRVKEPKSENVRRKKVSGDRLKAGILKAVMAGSDLTIRFA